MLTIRRLLLLTIIMFLGLSLKAQYMHYGVKAGLNYSYYHLSNQYVFHETEGAGLGFHGGAFVRRDLGMFFAQVDADFIYGMKGKVSFRGNESEISMSAISVPLSLGRYFNSDMLRVYAGLVPGYYFGTENLMSFLETSHLNAPGSYGGGPGLGYLFGTGFDLKKPTISIDIRYEGNILGGFYSVSRDPNILTDHRFSHLMLSLGFRLK